MQGLLSKPWDFLGLVLEESAETTQQELADHLGGRVM